MSKSKQFAAVTWKFPFRRRAQKSVHSTGRNPRFHLGFYLACALSAIPINALAVPILTLNESSTAENLLSVQFDALGNGTNVLVPLGPGGLSTGVIPGLQLSDSSIGIYIEQADGTFKQFPIRTACAGTTNGAVLGDCVTLFKNEQGGVLLLSFASDILDPPDAGNTEMFTVGPVGRPPELTVQIVSLPENVPEPPGLAVLAIGLLGLGWFHMRRARASVASGGPQIS